MIFFSTLLSSSPSSHLENLCGIECCEKGNERKKEQGKMHNDHDGQMPARCLKLDQSSFIQLEEEE